MFAWKPGVGGTWPRKGGMGMCCPEDPLFTTLLQFARVPISSKKVSSQVPLLRKSGNFSPYNLNFHSKFSSQAPEFWKFSAHKPPYLEILCSQAPKFGNFQFKSPPFQRQVSVRKPHTSEIQAAHPYLKKKKKKSWVPPPPGHGSCPQHDMITS